MNFSAQSWYGFAVEAVKLYKDRRLLVVFLLGFSSGFPWVLIGSVMTAWLQESGLSRSAIGFFGSIFVVYAFNFAWAPLLDRVSLPVLSRGLGQRRSWILAMQLLMFVFVVLLATTDPGKSILWTSLVALSIAICSATQDVAIDAYRIEVIGEHEQSKISGGAAMATSGWWTGYSLPGAAAFIAADFPGVTWSHVYLGLSAVLLVLMVVVLISPEPKSNRLTKQHEDEAFFAKQFNADGVLNVLQKVQVWLLVTLVQPIREFFQRNGWQIALTLLLFVFLFKIGEAFLGRMSIVFYKEIGFSNTDIGVYSKLVGWWVTIIFSLIGGVVASRFGLLRGLMIGGIAMAATNLMFSWMAIAGPVPQLFAATVIVDNFTSAVATVAFVAFISHLTSRAYTASQYALMASLGNLGRTTLAAFSGVMVDGLGGNWSLFFIITALMVTPSLVLLMFASRRLGVSAS